MAHTAAAATAADDAQTDATTVASPVADGEIKATSSSADESGGPGPTVRKTEDEDDGPPAQRLTGHQIFYIFFMHGFVSMLIAGSIDFGVAYAMYANENPITEPIRLWEFPNTLAGDTAVSIIIQCLVTWLVEGAVLGSDLRRRHVRPLRLRALPRPTSPLAKRFFLLDAHAAAASPRGRRDHPRPLVAGFFAFLLAQVLRALLFAVPSLLVLWPPAVGVLFSIGKRHGSDLNFAPTWTPEIYKAVLAGLLALFITPLMASFWLARAGWGETEEDSQQE